MTTSTTDALGRIQPIVIGRLGVEQSKVVSEASFTDDLNADSLDMVAIFIAIEREFGIEISLDDSDQIVTVRDAVDAVLEGLGIKDE